MGRRCKARSASRPEAREAAIKHMMEGVAAMKTSEKGLIKSIHGGGGKGTAHLPTPDDPAAVRAACEKAPRDPTSSWDAPPGDRVVTVGLDRPESVTDSGVFLVI